MSRLVRSRGEKQRGQVWITGKDGDQLELYRQIIREKIGGAGIVSDKMDSSIVSEIETAYLVEKTIQQALTLFILGTLLTGLVYTALLLATPNNYCTSRNLRSYRLLTGESSGENITQKDIKESETVEAIISDEVDDRDDRSVTLDSILRTAVCGAFNSPGATAVVAAWTPLLLFSLASGGLVTQVQLLGREDLEVALLDIGDMDYGDVDGENMMFLSI